MAQYKSRYVSYLFPIWYESFEFEQYLRFQEMFDSRQSLQQFIDC